MAKLQENEHFSESVNERRRAAVIQLDVIGDLRDLNLLSVGVRIALAMLFGGTIGFERGLRQRAAGLSQSAEIIPLFLRDHPLY